METKVISESNPSLQKVLQGYKRFNAWELEEQAIRLPELSVTESINQFFQLCALSQLLAKNAALTFFKQDEQDWIILKCVRQQAARKMGYARTARSLARSQDIS
jgi:hypothetical protein